MVNGTLISFEGPEGAGKSSVLEAVLPLLEEKGIPFITTREPGGVDIAEKDPPSHFRSRPYSYGCQDRVVALYC